MRIICSKTLLILFISLIFLKYNSRHSKDFIHLCVFEAGVGCLVFLVT